MPLVPERYQKSGSPGGEWDEIIMGEDAQIIFDAFFAKLEAALAELAA